MEPLKAEVFTRHSADCKYKTQRYYRDCRCRKWIHVFGNNHRISAGTRSWAKAEEKRKSIERGEAEEPKASEAVDSIAKVVKDFLEMKQAKVKDNGFRKYQRELTDFIEWCEYRYERQLTRLADLDLRALEKYQVGWQGATISRNKRLERFCTFFNYAMLHKLATENHAKGLTKFRGAETETLPYEPKEFDAILGAVDRYHARGLNREWYRQRARAMILLLRWSGLRISDAAKLERKRLDPHTHKLVLYMSKTSKPISVPLPPELVEMLFALPNVNPRYFFWNGTSDADSPGKRWWSTIKKIAKLAGVEDAHAHRFRDTFAVEALKSGRLTLLQVSKTLGHSSVKITEEHYLPWVPELQAQLEEAVRAMWPKSILTPAAPPLVVQ